LGDSDFVESVLEAAEEDLIRRYRLQAEGYDFEKVLDRVARLCDLKPSEILLPSKQPERIRARSLLCYWAVRELGMSSTEVAHRLGIHQSNVSRAVQRGGKLTAEKELSINF
jgi:chromosomal replication initiation ATPase DnaA